MNNHDNDLERRTIKLVIIVCKRKVEQLKICESAIAGK